ncbi:hypothetical protein [Fontibacter flavus]|uniref:Uncharacterized protein n=1 Tax=Fontibacter flavus TaxID=654838 RepID=A0ABV6FN07_9BACT
MKNLSLLILSLMFPLSIFAQHGVLKSTGVMSELGKNGFSPTISMDSLQKSPWIFGLGSLGKMQGEIIAVYSHKGKRIYTHHDTNVHAHFINSGKTFTGHIDKLKTNLNSNNQYLPKQKII